jgi:hypothetical protein
MATWPHDFFAQMYSTLAHRQIQLTTARDPALTACIGLYSALETSKGINMTRVRSSRRRRRRRRRRSPINSTNATSGHGAAPSLPLLS